MTVLSYTSSSKSPPNNVLVFWGKLSLLAPIFLFVILINYFVDPAHILCKTDRSYEEGMAALLLKGLNVADASNYDERLLQEFYIKGLTESDRKEIIVLGSSRAGQICSNLFPLASFFNNSVSGGSLEDYVAITGIYLGKGLLPKEVILGIDPWLFNRNNGQNRWKSIKILLLFHGQ